MAVSCGLLPFLVIVLLHNISSVGLVFADPTLPLVLLLKHFRSYIFSRNRKRISTFSFEISLDNIFQKLFPINTRNDVSCASVSGNVSRIFCQYVSDDLPNRIIPFFLQGIIHLHHSLFAHQLIQLLSPHKKNTTFL